MDFRALFFLCDGNTNIGFPELLGKLNEHMKHLAHFSGTIIVILTDNLLGK